MTAVILAAWVLIVPPVYDYKSASSGFKVYFATQEACEAATKRIKYSFCAATGATP